MNIVVLKDQHGYQITPEGCGYEDCGVPKQRHPQLYSKRGRWHSWLQPLPGVIRQRAWALRRLKDQETVEDGQRAQAAADETAFARWLHEGGSYGRRAR